MKSRCIQCGKTISLGAKRCASCRKTAKRRKKGKAERYTHCQRKGCTNRVPPGRRKYCSTRCSKIANRDRARENERPVPLPRSRKGEVKQRQCLRCNKWFRSQHRGNWICKTCQRKAEHGTPVAPGRVPGNDIETTKVYKKLKDLPLSPDSFEMQREESDDEQEA